MHKRQSFSIFYLMLALYSPGVIPVYRLKTKLKWESESKQSRHAASVKVYFCRISFFASSTFSRR